MERAWNRGPPAVAVAATYRAAVAVDERAAAAEAAEVTAARVFPWVSLVSSHGPVSFSGDRAFFLCDVAARNSSWFDIWRGTRGNPGSLPDCWEFRCEDFLKFCSLLAGVLLAPLGEYAIERTAHGESLGIISSGEFRSALLLAISFPIAGLAVFVLSSKRFASKQRSGFRRLKWQ